MAAASLIRAVQQRMSGEAPRARAIGLDEESGSPTWPSTATLPAHSTEEIHVQGLTKLMALSSRNQDSSLTTNKAVMAMTNNKINPLTRLLDLPVELQVMVLGYLNFGDLERLRRTCHLLRSRITRSVVRDLFPVLKYELLSTCRQCLAYDPARSHLVRAEETHPRYPFANECLDCVVAGDGFAVGKKVTMGDFRVLWVCRWCGIPVADGAAWNQPEFHYRCYRRFHTVLFCFFLAGCAQWSFVLVAEGLCWAFFRRDVLVLAPTIVSFWSCFRLFVFSSLSRGRVV